MKKKITILLLMIFATANIYSQNYNISFAASGASTTVGTVKVDNLAQNTSLTLNGNDILHLGTVGINETEYNTNNPMIYPNPMRGKAELFLYTEQEGDVQISISDISGKEVLYFGNKYSKGNHKFQLNGLKQGIYFLNIISKSYSYSLKLISQNSNQNENPALIYLGYENETSGKLKNTNTTVNMLYNNGDRLLFKGTSGNYSNIITDIPTSSKTITFYYTACSDFDNNNYATIKIGNQTWMAENLRYLPSVVGPGTGSETIAYHYVYGYDGTNIAAAKTTSNYIIYGVLYNWPAAMAGSASNATNPSGVQGVCPTGWHLPSDAEWTELTNYLGGESVAGGKLKETGLTHWISPNTGATNETGFTALPGSNRYFDGTFGGFGLGGYWWSATEDDAGYPWFRYVYNNYSDVFRYGTYKESGFSIRCLKD